MQPSKSAPRFLPTLTEIVHQTSPEVSQDLPGQPAAVEVSSDGERDLALTARAQEIAKAYLDQHLPTLIDQHIQQLIPHIYSAVDALIWDTHAEVESPRAPSE